MRSISLMADPSWIRDILNHLGLWLVQAKPPPLACAPLLTYQKLIPLILQHLGIPLCRFRFDRSQPLEGGQSCDSATHDQLVRGNGEYR
jgi:hypothetical protein